MYRKSHRKSGSPSRNVGSPPYFHFRFGRQRPLVARFFAVFWPILPPYRSRWSGDRSKRSRSSAGTTSGSDVSSWFTSSVKVTVLQLFTALRRAVVVGGCRKSDKKSGSLSWNIGSPPYFHFRFGLQRPSDARFCRILANILVVSFVMVRRCVQEVRVVRGLLLPIRSCLADSRVE